MFSTWRHKEGSPTNPLCVFPCVAPKDLHCSGLSSSAMGSSCPLPPSQCHWGFLPGLGELSIPHRSSRHSFFPTTCCNWGGTLSFLGEWKAQIHFKTTFLYLCVVLGQHYGLGEFLATECQFHFFQGFSVLESEDWICKKRMQICIYKVQ